jgi:hypothetical protein
MKKCNCKPGREGTLTTYHDCGPREDLLSLLGIGEKVPGSAVVVWPIVPPLPPKTKKRKRL